MAFSNMLMARTEIEPPSIYLARQLVDQRNHTSIELKMIIVGEFAKQIACMYLYSQTINSPIESGQETEYTIPKDRVFVGVNQQARQGRCLQF